MVTYDKPKRKNAPIPTTSILKMVSSFISGLLKYGVVLPARWLWRQVTRFAKWNWHLTQRFFGWIGRQIGTLFRGTWWIITSILHKTVFAPFIAVGRLLGFVPGAVPKGLSPQEAEIYQRINRHYRRQKRWYLHIISFLIGMVVLWITQVFSSWNYPKIDTAIMLTLVWLVILGTHRLWMNLGKSEDHELGEALQRLRNTEQTIYYEEEIYEQRPYDTSHLEDRAYHDAEWIDDNIVKVKRQHN